MKLTRDQMLKGMYRRDARLNGRYLVAVTSTKIYCLPDCPARKPKADNVLFFLNEQDAQQAGFRPCKRCRPQHYYRGIDPERSAIEEIVDRIHNDPADFATAAAVGKASGFGMTKLNALTTEHFHMSVAGLLQRARLNRARSLLSTGQVNPTEAGFAVGYRSLASFYDQFAKQCRMTPASYAALGTKSFFTLSLPPGYQPTGIAGLLGRSDIAPHQGFQAGHGFKVLSAEEVPFICRFEMAGSHVHCTLGAGSPLPPTAPRVAHRAMLKLLGLSTARPSVSQFSKAPWRRLVAPAPALRPSVFPGPFEALVWAIIGQQINVAFATRLLVRLVGLAGSPLVDGKKAFPTPVQIANLDPGDLISKQFSRTKAATLIDSSREIVSGRLALADLNRVSADTASQQLTNIKGIGPWTAQYTLMRGFGLGDCLPVGDSGLRNGLMRFFSLPTPPDHEASEQLTNPFKPYRTLATHHLWNSFQPIAKKGARS